MRQLLFLRSNFLSSVKEKDCQSCLQLTDDEPYHRGTGCFDNSIMQVVNVRGDVATGFSQNC